MKTRQLLSFILGLLSLSCISCSCWGVDDYFSFFKYNTTSFVGRVVAVNGKGDFFEYSFEVVSKLRSKFHDTVIINNRNNAIGCTASFEVGKVYLLTPRKKDRVYTIDRCDYIERSDDKFFQLDTMLIRQLALKNVSLDNAYFKGSIKNGNRVGKWEFYFEGTGQTKEVGEAGIFVQGKKDGEWLESGTKIYYKKGKVIRVIELLKDSLTVEIKGKTKTMYYSDGKIYKIMTKYKYTSFYPSGKIWEQANLRKRKYIIGNWVLFNENGTIKDKTYIPKDYLLEVFDAFYMHYYKDSLPK